ncbi:MAG: STAS domain-containing protein [Cytophagales bacterium]
MKVILNIEEQLPFVSLEGDLIGESNGLEVVDLITNLINKNLVYVVFDLENLRYMNSSGIGVLITAHTKLKNNKGELILLKPNDQINKLLTITKLNTIFKIFQDKKDTLDYLKK